MSGFRAICLAVVALALVCASGCAVFMERNRRTLNALDEAVQVEEPAARIALAPVFVPVGTLALATDALLVNPCVAIPNAANDTGKMLWDKGSGSEFWDMIMFTPKVAATPLVFGGMWVIDGFVWPGD
jgi:hypothetical protein